MIKHDANRIYQSLRSTTGYDPKFDVDFKGKHQSIFILIKY